MTYQDRIALWQNVPLARWPSDLIDARNEHEAKEAVARQRRYNTYTIAGRAVWVIGLAFTALALPSFWPLAVLAALGLLWMARPLP